jgi:hypothetical protein
LCIKNGIKAKNLIMPLAVVRDKKQRKVDIAAKYMY